MAGKIRLGFIGANMRSKWAQRSHFPALQASPDVELTAVCTTNPASAEEARQTLGAKLAFSDYREMATSPAIDAIAVVVRVPSHFAPAEAAIAAGKHVYVEWPLGRTTAEAEQLRALARAKGVQTAVGLQSRVSPTLLYMKALLETGYVGRVLSCSAITMRGSEQGGFFERHSSKTWLGDASLGVGALTNFGGHVIDALRFVAGDFVQLGGMVTTQVKQWLETDTQRMVDVSAPDNVLVHGRLSSGAVASIQIGIVPWAPSGYRMEIYGTEGTLIASGRTSSNLGQPLRLQGAQRSQELHDIAIPESFSYLPKDFPRDSAFNVGQMYALFAQAIRTGQSPIQLPTFDTAGELHRITDAITRASAAERNLEVDPEASSGFVDDARNLHAVPE